MSRWSRPPRALRRPGVVLDNIALVPASLLPHKARYQALANRLPHGDVLIVLPDRDSPERAVLQSAAARFEAKGHRVTLVPAARIARDRDHDHQP